MFLRNSFSVLLLAERKHLMTQMERKLILFFVVSLIFFVWYTTAVQAQKKSVVEEILDILLANHQISEEQYQYLLKKAKAEEQERTQGSTTKTISQKESLKENREVSRSGEKRYNETRINTYWKDGLHFETDDNRFSITIGGKIHYDWGYINEDADVGKFVGEDFGSGSKMRRARLFVKGNVYDNIDFKAEYGFSGGEVKVKDLYLGMKNIPFLGTLRIGHTKEPFSLEELTCGSDVTFMERSLPNAIVPRRNIGFLAHNFAFDKRLSWSVGVFSETDGQGNGFGENDRYNLTGRLSFLPWYRNNGKDLLYVGGSYSHKFMDDGTEERYRARPESHLTDTHFLDTGNIPTDEIDLCDAELALVLSSFSIQSEYVRTFLNPSSGDRMHFDGFYVYGSYFLTGEHRHYAENKEAFGHVKPRRNFQVTGGGWGALEAAFRYSYLDLDDEEIHGGIMNEYTVGLNWYLNPHSRLMFNFIHSHLNNIGDTEIFQSRFQLDF
ncbi:MAG: hypothetical protein DRG83_18125 [Deltaproteobacteria bacterium]|nr:MAG: hypothetical protein DRG83_18125 [Deltaproteobacteria bacterium]